MKLLFCQVIWYCIRMMVEVRHASDYLGMWLYTEVEYIMFKSGMRPVHPGEILVEDASVGCLIQGKSPIAISGMPDKPSVMRRPVWCQLVVAYYIKWFSYCLPPLVLAYRKKGDLRRVRAEAKRNPFCPTVACRRVLAGLAGERRCQLVCYTQPLDNE